MGPSRLAVPLIVLASALALGGCGAGAGDDQRTADVSLLVTSDHGARPVGDVPAAPAVGSLLDYLRAGFEATTGPGGAVTAIAGERGDWHLFVNGVERDEDPATTRLHGGDRVWWDRHAATPDVRAVIGAYPEPFRHGLDGKRWPTRVECVKDGDKAPCDEIARRLGDAGVIAAQALTGTEGGEENLRVLVGPWAQIRSDRAARLVVEGPRSSGVFARFSADGSRLELLDARGEPVRTAGPGAGLIAATRSGEEPPTWFVTGTDAAGVQAAVRAFDEGTLANRFALAVIDDRGIPLPTRPIE